MDYSRPGSSVHGISEVRILEWVAISPPGNLLHPKVKPASRVSLALAGELITSSTTWEARWLPRSLDFLCLEALVSYVLFYVFRNRHLPNT